jgi:predicted nucleic acid-binding protein
MSGPCLDTNVLLRYVLNDHPVHSPASTKLIGRISRNEVQAWMTDLAIAEAVFVLSNPKTYNVSRSDIRDALLPVLSLPGVDLPGKHLYPRIFDLYAKMPIDFVDAYHAAHAEQRVPPDIYSYDAHFDRIPSVRRLEP